MLKYLVATIAALVIAAPTAEAAFPQLYEPPKYEQRYLAVYEKAQKVIGKEDAGRNIYVDGLPGGVSPSKGTYERITEALQGAIDVELAPRHLSS